MNKVDLDKTVWKTLLRRTTDRRLRGRWLSDTMNRVHSESVVLDIGQDMGTLIIYTDAELRGREIEVSPRGSVATRIQVEVLERN